MDGLGVVERAVIGFIFEEVRAVIAGRCVGEASVGSQTQRPVLRGLIDIGGESIAILIDIVGQ